MLTTSDLSGVGLRSDKGALIEAMLKPSAQLEAAHKAVQSSLDSVTPLELTDLISFLMGLKEPARTTVR